MIRAAFTPNEQTSLNRSYRELARHYGFKVDPTPPYSPQKKGKVESGVKYLKTSVLQGRDGEDASVPKSKVIDLATCTFVRKHENVLLLGPAGVGKSHLAQALGHHACHVGFNVMHVSAHDMLKQLRAARGDATYERMLLRFTTPDVLLLDDLGLRPLIGDETLDLYEVIRQRYERAPFVLTSNRAEDEIAALFGDALLASAAIDRLLHRAHVLVIEGDSYRNPSTNRRSRGNAKEARK